MIAVHQETYRTYESIAFKLGAPKRVLTESITGLG